MSRFYPNGNDLIPKLSTWKPKILGWWNNSGTSVQGLQVDNNGNVSSIDTVITSISVGDFTGAYAGLATESNWVNNFNNTIAGSSGDCHFGLGTSGCFYYTYYGQSGWNRWYSNNVITDSVLIGALQTSTNWSTSTYNAIRGDLLQEYIDSTYKYECINGTSHTWIRHKLDISEVISTDITFLPSPQVHVSVADNSTIIIPAKYDIVHLCIEAETTNAGNISIGSADGLSDIVASTALPIVVGTKLRLVYLINSIYPTNANRTLYVNIDNILATVKVHIVKQKMCL